jgi:NAD(P)-dependent dehydrogenase (short-subunit alcohol dehydrogenase family)
MGAATAMRLLTEGAAVYVVTLDVADRDALVQTARGDGVADRLVAENGDLREPRVAADAVAACVGRFGRIDGVFAAAGASARSRGDGPVEDSTLDGVQAAFELNGWPAFTVVQAAVPAMLDQDTNPSGTRGSIVLMSSVLATHPSPRLFATHGYAAAKGAIESLTISMAARYAGNGIRVNAIAPGLVDTPMSGRARRDAETMRYLARKQPLAGGPLPADDAAAAVAFLLSDEARYITGQVLAYDGGWSVSEAAD